MFVNKREYNENMSRLSNLMRDYTVHANRITSLEMEVDANNKSISSMMAIRDNSFEALELRVIKLSKQNTNLREALRLINEDHEKLVNDYKRFVDCHNGNIRETKSGFTQIENAVNELHVNIGELAKVVLEDIESEPEMPSFDEFMAGVLSKIVKEQEVKKTTKKGRK